MTDVFHNPALVQDWAGTPILRITRTGAGKIPRPGLASSPL